MIDNQQLTTVLKKIAYSGRKALPILFLAVATCCITTSCTSNHTINNRTIYVDDATIWQYPDSAWQVLAAIDCSELSEKQQMERQLEQLLAGFRIGRLAPPEQIHPMIDYYQSRDNKEELGLALYCMSRAFSRQGKQDSAMAYLKEAEQYTAHIDSRYAGMIYYSGGAILESEQLFHIALENYRKALPYMREANDSVWLLICLRDIGRMMQAYPDSSHLVYTNEAKKIATSIGQGIFYYDICAQETANHEPMDSDRMYEVSKLLCDSFGFPRYAGYVSSIAMKRGDFETAHEYLNFFSYDTAMIASKYYYYLYDSELQYHDRKKDQAFQQLADAYCRLLVEDQKEGNARTFAIARHYDVEKEQIRNLELTLRQQHTTIVVSIMASAGIVLFLIVCLVFLHERQRRLMKEREAEILALRTKEQAQQLILKEQELQAKKTTLRDELLLRVRLTKDMEAATAGHPDLPKKIQQIIDSIDLRDQRNWQLFCEEFDAIHEGLLQKLETAYPSLTEQDMQYLALIMLQFNSQEIATLLHINPQSVWNRRQRVKSHLNISNIELEDWLEKQVAE